MPASSEHAQRIRQGLDFIGAAYSKDHANELVIAFFYCALHMFEAAVYDFTAKPRPRHYYTHGDRTKFLASVKFQTSHPFFPMVSDYEALRGLSEQARYLSPAGAETYEPLRLPRDRDDAEALFKNIREKIENVYTLQGKKAPWLLS